VVEWKCPWLVFLGGTWVNLGMRPIDVGSLPQGHAHGQPTAAAEAAATGAPAAAAATSTPAGWHPDPQGQAALRYWDGQQWTEHTSDGQATAG
jgi:hypothetical protein